MAKKPAMTMARGRKVLRSIGDYWEVHGYGPAIRDLAASTGITSTYMVKYWIDRLENEGYVAKGPPLSCRTLRLTRSGNEAMTGPP